MPYPAEMQVSPSDRQDEILRATKRVIARDGLDRASLRAIAQEIGCTTGVLTHHFRDKDALFAFVLEEIGQSFLNAQLAFPLDADLDTMIAFLTSTLPSTDEAERLWIVWLSFTVHSLAEERRNQMQRRRYFALRRFWTALFTAAQKRGDIRPEIDPAIEAIAVISLCDGLGLQALISTDEVSAGQQAAVIKSYFARLRAAAPPA